MIACAYSGEMFWLAVAVALVGVGLALYEQHRHHNEERSLRNNLRTTERALALAVVEAELVRSDPERWWKG